MNILYVTPRLPYPVDTGAKIRTFNLIKQTRAVGNRVVLLSFIYTEKEKTGIEAIEDMGIDVITVKGNDSIDLFMMAKAFFHGLPLTVAKYRNKKMVFALNELINNCGIDLVHFDHVHLGQYADYCNGIPSVIDEHNVESIILRRYAERESNLLKKIALKREYRKMKQFERKQCLKASKVFVVSENDRDILIKLCSNDIDPEIIPNGVDTEYFTTPDTRVRSEAKPPRRGHLTPEDESIVFVGSMDWLPNVDAVNYFCKDILPLIWEKKSKTKFCIVGKEPPSKIRSMAKRDNRIIVTGSVEDVRPFVAASEVFAVPLRIGGGTRLKILEALASGRAVVSTSIGIEGLDVKANEHLLVADSNYDFAGKILHVLENERLRSQLGEKGSRFVKENYDWNNIGKKLINVYKEVMRDGRQKG